MQSGVLLTNQNKACCLEKTLIVPVGVLLLQNVTHTVVFPEPDSGIHHKARDQAECFMAYCELELLTNVGWVVHLDLNIFNQRRVHLTIQYLRSQHT